MECFFFQGQHFDISPEVLTLQNIFSMDLGRYKDICMEIVANSVKEMSIELTIKDIEKVSIIFIMRSIKYNDN